MRRIIAWTTAWTIVWVMRRMRRTIAWTTAWVMRRMIIKIHALVLLNGLHPRTVATVLIHKLGVHLLHATARIPFDVY